MDLFATTTEILVLSLMGGTFAAMATLSVLDSITDHKALMARFSEVTCSMPNMKAR